MGLKTLYAHDDGSPFRHLFSLHYFYRVGNLLFHIEEQNVFKKRCTERNTSMQIVSKLEEVCGSKCHSWNSSGDFLKTKVTMDTS